VNGSSLRVFPGSEITGSLILHVKSSGGPRLVEHLIVVRTAQTNLYYVKGDKIAYEVKFND